MVSAALTSKFVFDLRPADVYWCTADCGWITGHTYLTYGPLLNGVTSLIFEGVPTHPTPARCWQIIEKYKVRILPRHTLDFLVFGCFLFFLAFVLFLDLGYVRSR